MCHRLKENPSKRWGALFAAGLISLSLLTVAVPLALESPWVAEEGLCISKGDVPICEGSFVSEETKAIGNLHLVVNQDSPVFGTASHAEKRFQFEKPFTAESPIRVAFSAELTGTLRIEGGDGEVVVRASAVILDAETNSPVSGMQINSSTFPGSFSQSLSAPEAFALRNSGTQTATLPAGTYIILGSIEATVEMAVGWRNLEAEADVALTVELLIGDDAPATPQATPDPIDQPDFIVVPLGVEGTSYAHLSPGVRGGTFHAAALLEPTGWNAVTAHEDRTTRYTNIMMRGLVDIDPNTGLLVPELARSWDVSEDGLEILIHLRRGLKWSDGEPFGADDVLFTFNDLYYNLDVETDIRDILRLPDGTFPEFEKIDDDTLLIRLSVPFRPILTALGSRIMPKHVLASSVHKLNPAVPVGQFNSMWQLDADPSEIVGMGPFILESYFPGQSVTLRRNPYYYHVDPKGVQLPYLDKYAVLKAENKAFALLDFRSQKLDAFTPRERDVLVLLSPAAKNDFTLLVSPVAPVYGTSWVCINQDYGLSQGTNENLRALFRDIRFRKAVAHSIDKEIIIHNVYSGHAVPQWSPVSQSSPYYAGRTAYGGPVTEEDAVVYGFNLEEAMRLLDEIGVIDRNNDGWRDFEDGTTVEIELKTATEFAAPDWRDLVRESICSIITDDLRRAGLKVKFQILDFNSLVEGLQSSTLQMVLLGLDTRLEPNDEARVYQSTGEQHYWHYSAAENDVYEIELLVDELLWAGAATFDNDAAFEAYKEFQIAYAENDLGLIFTVNPAFTYAYFNRIGNANVANPIATPSGGNGLTMDLIYLKSD